MTDSELCTNVLANYNVEAQIVSVKTHHPMPHNTVYVINDGAFYVLQDDSAMDDVMYVAKQFSEIDAMLHGQILPNPVPQSDGALFASGYDGKEYYVWRSV